MSMFDGPIGPDLTIPDGLIRLATAVHRFRCPDIGAKKLSYKKSFKTTSSSHANTQDLMNKADAARDKLAQSLSTATVQYNSVNQAAEAYLPRVQQVLFSCKVQPEAARLDQKLLFEWTSGIEATKKATKTVPTTFSSEALMYELVMVIASDALSCAGMGCDASIAGDFASASKKFKRASGVFDYLGQDQLPKWIARGSSVNVNDLPAEVTAGVCDSFAILYLAYAQQMAFATALVKKTKPNYSLMAKIALGISEQIDDAVKMLRSKAVNQMERLDDSFLTLLAFQTAYTKSLSSYFLARSAWEEDSNYGPAIALLKESIAGIQKRAGPGGNGVPDVEGKNSPLKALANDLQAVRKHMQTMLKEWEKDNSTVYFDQVPGSVPSDFRLDNGTKLMTKGDEYKIDENLAPMPLSIPLMRALIPPPYQPDERKMHRSDSDLARELQAKLNAGL